MLGELYKPKGLALETAQAVLEVTEPCACNVAFGCSNQCLYCYVPKLTRQKRTGLVLYPKIPPVDMVRKQLEKMPLNQRPKGVFISFCTDPYLPKSRDATENLISLLLDEGAKVATLSKLDVSSYYVRQGMTVVSLDLDFWQKFEPNTRTPRSRINALGHCARGHDYVWVSMEPYPPSAIYKQSLIALLEELNFVDLIVFGKWNYDKRANTDEARKEYAKNIEVLTDFCKSNNIRLHVKSDTMKFTKGNP